MTVLVGKIYKCDVQQENNYWPIEKYIIFSIKILYLLVSYWLMELAYHPPITSWQVRSTLKRAQPVAVVGHFHISHFHCHLHIWTWLSGPQSLRSVHWVYCTTYYAGLVTSPQSWIPSQQIDTTIRHFNKYCFRTFNSYAKICFEVWRKSFGLFECGQVWSLFG